MSALLLSVGTVFSLRQHLVSYGFREREDKWVVRRITGDVTSLEKFGILPDIFT